MYRTATVINVTGTEALILFTDLNIQKKAEIMKEVTVAPGDTAIVLSQDNLTNCMIIGVKEQ
jgi:hypothetical protein